MRPDKGLFPLRVYLFIFVFNLPRDVTFIYQEFGDGMQLFLSVVTENGNPLSGSQIDC